MTTICENTCFKPPIKWFIDAMKYSVHVSNCLKCIDYSLAKFSNVVHWPCIHERLTVAPNKVIQWIQIGWTWWPGDGTTSPNPTISVIERLAQPISRKMTKMRRCAIVHEPHSSSPVHWYVLEQFWQCMHQKMVVVSTIQSWWKKYRAKQEISDHSTPNIQRKSLLMAWFNDSVGIFDVPQMSIVEVVDSITCELRFVRE